MYLGEVAHCFAPVGAVLVGIKIDVLEAYEFLARCQFLGQSLVQQGNCDGTPG